MLSATHSLHEVLHSDTTVGEERWRQTSYSFLLPAEKLSNSIQTEKNTKTTFWGHKETLVSIAFIPMLNSKKLCFWPFLTIISGSQGAGEGIRLATQETKGGTSRNKGENGSPDGVGKGL